MAADKAATLEQIRSVGIVAVVRAASAGAAVSIARALAAGGVTAVEITFTTPGAADAIRQLADDAGMVLGAGTVVSADQAEAAVDAGARFLVSPHLALDVVAVAKRRGVAVMPGALTPGEVFAAYTAGADWVKIFPAARMGPSYLRDLRGPYPDIPLMPTGGVSVENVREWLEAGAAALGAGSELVDKRAVAEGRWEALTDRARAFVDAVAMARSAR